MLPRRSGHASAWWRSSVFAANVGGGPGCGHSCLKHPSQEGPSGIHFEQQAWHTLQPPGSAGLQCFGAGVGAQVGSCGQLELQHPSHDGPSGIHGLQHSGQPGVHPPAAFGLHSWPPPAGAGGDGGGAGGPAGTQCPSSGRYPGSQVAHIVPKQVAHPSTPGTQPGVGACVGLGVGLGVGGPIGSQFPFGPRRYPASQLVHVTSVSPSPSPSDEAVHVSHHSIPHGMQPFFEVGDG